MSKDCCVPTTSFEWVLNSLVLLCITSIYTSELSWQCSAVLYTNRPFWRADVLIKHFLKFLWQLHMASHTSFWFSCNSTPNFWALFYSLCFLPFYIPLFSFFCYAVWVKLVTLSLFSVISSLVCHTALRISINISLLLVFSSLVCLHLIPHVICWPTSPNLSLK
jgi:hypothetical protein